MRHFHKLFSCLGSCLISLNVALAMDLIYVLQGYPLYLLHPPRDLWKRVMDKQKHWIWLWFIGTVLSLPFWGAICRNLCGATTVCYKRHYMFSCEILFLSYYILITGDLADWLAEREVLFRQRLPFHYLLLKEICMPSIFENLSFMQCFI